MVAITGMHGAVVRGDALAIPLRDESVDLIVTSPPYFALRSYRDGGEHYEGQIGSEATPQAFLEALWAVTRECWRVLKPSGSMFVNLGDKRSGSGGHNNSGISKPRPDMYGAKAAAVDAVTQVIDATRRNAPDRYNQAAFGRPKSKMLLPHRFAIGCEDGMADPDGIGWVVRQDQVWHKANGLPESVTDRTRDSHEFWFHLTKEERYFSAVDEIREPTHREGLTWEERKEIGPQGCPDNGHMYGGPGMAANPLGRLPDSVWKVASEPLIIPADLGLPDHFAAFPQEWPRRLILGFSPSAVCTGCGEGRRPMTRTDETSRINGNQRNGKRDATTDAAWSFTDRTTTTTTTTTIVGYACGCRDSSAPTRPAVVLDPLGGTGTTAGVARMLGRLGISLDLSADYCRLARWRIEKSGHFSKSFDRTNRENQRALDFTTPPSVEDVPVIGSSAVGML